jgi:hypothetical protein
MFLGESSMSLLAGLGLAVGIITKVTPTVFLGYLLINRRLEVIIGALCATIALCILAGLRYGFGLFPKYLEMFKGLRP